MRFHRPVSMDEVLDSTMKARELRPSDFAGTVIMTDREADEISRELNRFWSKWRSPSGSSLDTDVVIEHLRGKTGPSLSADCRTKLRLQLLSSTVSNCIMGLTSRRIAE